MNIKMVIDEKEVVLTPYQFGTIMAALRDFSINSDSQEFEDDVNLLIDKLDDLV